MEPKKASLLEACARHGGRLCDEQLADVVECVGVQYYYTDLRRHTTTYYLRDGDALAIEFPCSGMPVARTLNVPDLEQVLMTSHSNAILRRDLVMLLRRAGCVGLIVSVVFRTITYLGYDRVHVRQF